MCRVQPRRPVAVRVVQGPSQEVLGTQCQHFRSAQSPTAPMNVPLQRRHLHRSEGPRLVAIRCKVSRMDTAPHSPRPHTPSSAVTPSGAHLGDQRGAQAQACRRCQRIRTVAASLHLWARMWRCSRGGGLRLWAGTCREEGRQVGGSCLAALLSTCTAAAYGLKPLGPHIWPNQVTEPRVQPGLAARGQVADQDSKRPAATCQLPAWTPGATQRRVRTSSCSVRSFSSGLG